MDANVHDLSILKILFPIESWRQVKKHIWKLCLLLIFVKQKRQMLFKSYTIKNVWQRCFRMTIKHRAFFFIITIGIKRLLGVSSKCDVTKFFSKATIYSSWFILHWTIHKNLIFFKNVSVKINFRINICCGHYLTITTKLNTVLFHHP